MIAATSLRSAAEVTDEADAFRRVVLGLTAAIGGMMSAIGATTGQPVLIAGLPTLMLLGAIAARRVSVAGGAGVAVWLVVLPWAHDEALLAPLAMIVLCVAIAVSPDRLLSWIGRDLRGRSPRDAHLAEGWIEEDPIRIG